MNPPSPAIVAQNAVRRLPRWVVIALCAAYVLAGFVGREPWRDTDMAAFGYMQVLANGTSSWWHPVMAGLPADAPGPLGYWIGAWALQLAPAAWPADMVVRLPFMGLLALALSAMWWAVYGLARMPGAQPVAFAFGGEANPLDYARAMADGGLLALLACLGLAQMGHETSHTLVQLTGLCLAFYAASAMWWHRYTAALAGLFGLLLLSLAGAPGMAVLVSLGALWMALRVRLPRLPNRYTWTAWWLLCLLVAASAAWSLGLWQWQLINPWMQGKPWSSLGRLLVWFSWPAWPLAVWTLWRWRKQLARPWQHPHLAWPLWLWLLSLSATIFTRESERMLLLGLPAIAALATFALPTLRRSIGALIDWFTLLFFSLSGIIIWVIWLSLQTGIPAKPAANVARLAQGFTPSFAWFPFLIAVLASVAWLLLVAWRTRRHRAAIWKSLALPAGGATLGWLLLMTLWLPVLDYARGFAPHIQAVAARVPADAACVQTYGLSRAQSAALSYYTRWTLLSEAAPSAPSLGCPWLITTPQAWSSLPPTQVEAWSLSASVPRPTDRHDYLLVLQRRD